MRARIAVVGAGIGALLVVTALIRGPIPTGMSDTLLAAVLRAGAGTPILAEPIEAEQIALAGGRVWMGNPLDAFDRDDQRVYLAWTRAEQAGRTALDHAPRVVVVAVGGRVERALREDGRFRRVAADDRAAVYARR